MENNFDNYFENFDFSFNQSNNKKNDILSTFLNQNNNFPYIDDKAPIDDFFSRPENNVFNKIFDEQNNDNTKSDYEYPFLSLINAGSSAGDNNEQAFNDNKSIKEFCQKKRELNKAKPHPKDKEKEKRLVKRKAIFKAVQLDEIANPKELKLIQNRMSAKKSREKKKEYIEDLERELNRAQQELNEYKQIVKKNKTIDAYMNQMKLNEEKALNQLLPDSEIEMIKKDFKTSQSLLLNQLLNQLFQGIIPLELKLFYLRFLKLEEIYDKDTIESIEAKTIKNINILKELYSFSSVPIENKPKKDKDSIPWKLFKLFVNFKVVIDALKDYV